MQNFQGKEFLINIIEEFPEAVALCSSDKIIYANKRFQLISEYSTDEVQNLKLDNILAFVEDIAIGSMNGKEVKNLYQAELRTKNKKKIPSRVKLQKIGNIGIYCIIPMSEIACLNQAHLDFVSTVSHELRTPLTSIKGFSDTLLSAADQLSVEQKTRFITIIRDQVNRLTRLVEDLLTVSRLEAKKESSIKKEIVFSFFIDAIIQAMKQKSPEHYFQLRIADNLPCLYTDPDKLEQVLTNLLDNAAKYSVKGSTVKLKADFKHNNGDKIEIKVIDEGVGIAQEHLSKIFNKFARIDNPLTRNVPGTGLGLYITKTLVERLNGKISVESGNQGTTFTLEIPVSTDEMQMSGKFAEQGGN